MHSGFEVVRADPSQDRILRNLLEFYFHDLAEWFLFDQHSDGNYTESTDQYWRDSDIYFLQLEDIPIGFSIVGSADNWLPDSGARDMTEFFVVRRHRRMGIGREFASRVWGLHTGTWLVRVFQPNKPALPFWRKIISEYSSGHYEEQVIQKNGNDWSYFTFESRDA